MYEHQDSSIISEHSHLEMTARSCQLVALVAEQVCQYQALDCAKYLLLQPYMRKEKEWLYFSAVQDNMSICHAWLVLLLTSESAACKTAHRHGSVDVPVRWEWGGYGAWGLHRGKIGTSAAKLPADNALRQISICFTAITHALQLITMAIKMLPDARHMDYCITVNAVLCSCQ